MNVKHQRRKTSAEFINLTSDFFMPLTTILIPHDDLKPPTSSSGGGAPASIVLGRFTEIGEGEIRDLKEKHRSDILRVCNILDSRDLVLFVKMFGICKLRMWHLSIASAFSDSQSTFSFSRFVRQKQFNANNLEQTKMDAEVMSASATSSEILVLAFNI